MLGSLENVEKTWALRASWAQEDGVHLQPAAGVVAHPSSCPDLFLPQLRSRSHAQPRAGFSVQDDPESLAGTRMTFSDITGHPWHTECMGCDMGRGTLNPPGGIILANGSCYLHQDPEVPLEGFLVIGTRRHVQSLDQLSVGEHADLSSLLRHARRLMALVPDLHSVTLVQEERSTHFHLWLFPWYQWMIDRYGGVSLDHIRTIMADAKAEVTSPTQIERVLRWVERLRSAAGSGS